MNMTKRYCPKCGSTEVFVPPPAWRSKVPLAKKSDTVVMCADMGHWIGTLQETLEKPRPNHPHRER